MVDLYAGEGLGFKGLGSFRPFKKKNKTKTCKEKTQFTRR